MDWIAIAMGAFDTPTSTHLDKHIFVAEKGDCYQITDGLPQNLHYLLPITTLTVHGLPMPSCRAGHRDRVKFTIPRHLGSTL